MKKILIIVFISIVGHTLSAQRNKGSRVNSGKKGTLQIEAKTILKAIDSGDPAQFAKLLTETSVFKFGNFPAAVGKKAIFKAQTDFFASVKTTKHTILRTWRDDNSIVTQMEVSYVRLDGTTIILPVTDIFILDNNKISETLIYMDIAPLYNSN